MKIFHLFTSALLGLAFVQPGFAAPKAEEVQFYIKKLKGGNAKEKIDAIKELGHIGTIRTSFVKDAIPVLLTVAKDKDANVRSAALISLGQVGAKAEEAVPVLIEALKAGDDNVRRAGADGLVGFGPDAKAALADLKNIRAEIGKLDKEEQKKKGNLNRAVNQAIRAIEGNPKKN